MNTSIKISKNQLSDFLLKFLKKNGVKHVFLMTGGAISFTVDAFSRVKGIKYICVKHEQSAAMMADAYSRVTNFKNIGVTMCTSGPGATNLITGICCSWFDCIPTIHISGQVNLKEQRNKINKSFGCRQVGFQETDIVSITKSITKESIMIKNAEKFKSQLKHIWNKSISGKKGPVLIDIPLNLQRERLNNIKESDYKLINKIEYNRPVLLKKIKKLIELINSHEKLSIVVGGGIRLSNSENEFQIFKNNIQAPIFTTWSGFDLINYNDKNYFNTVGVYGHRHANISLQNSDLIIFLGSRVDTRITGGNIRNFCNNSKIILIDIDQNEMGKKRGLNPFMKIQTDLKIFLKLFNNYQKRKIFFKKWHKECFLLKEKYSLENSYYSIKRKNLTNPYNFIQKLSKKLQGNEIIIPDDGGHLTWTMQSFQIKKNQRLFSAFGNSPMGYCIPAAIGAKIAQPKKQVICIEGDGSFQINSQELHTIIENNLNIKIILFNNQGYGIIRQFQTLYLNKRLEASKKGISNPNFMKLIKSYGLNYYSIRNDNQIDKVLSKFLNSKKAGLLEIHINEDEPLVPKLDFGRPFYDLSPLLKRDELRSLIKN